LEDPGAVKNIKGFPNKSCQTSGRLFPENKFGQENAQKMLLLATAAPLWETNFHSLTFTTDNEKVEIHSIVWMSVFRFIFKTTVK
jgi:hypothetical protein